MKNEFYGDVFHSKHLVNRMLGTVYFVLFCYILLCPKSRLYCASGTLDLVMARYGTLDLLLYLNELKTA